MFSNKVYDVLKYVAQIGLPAVAVFYAAMAKIWGFPYADEVPATLAALVLLLGTLLGISSAQYYKSQG